MSAIEVNLLPFTFPNFIKVQEWTDHTYPVAMLSDEIAAAYWDELKPLWLAHVAEKRAAQQRELDRMLAMKNTVRP